ncbi:MAG: hypothetical protein ACWA5L_00425 [bacterium]
MRYGLETIVYPQGTLTISTDFTEVDTEALWKHWQAVLEPFYNSVDYDHYEHEKQNAAAAQQSEIGTDPLKFFNRLGNCWVEPSARQKNANEDGITMRNFLIIMNALPNSYSQ